MLGDTAAWAWPLFASPAAPRRFAADAEGHAALLRCLGESHGEAHSRVLIDLACETLHEQHTPALRWHDRRALAQQCRRNQFAADAVGLALAAGFGRRHRVAAVWSANAGLTARLAASADTWRSPACGAVFSQLAGRAAGAHAGRQPRPGAAVATWPGQRPTELAAGWPVRHSRQVGPARGGHQPGAGFFASQPDYLAHGIPTLWQTGRTTVWFTIQPWRAFSASKHRLNGWPDWLSAQLPPAGRLSLATRHIAATTGAMFAPQPPADPGHQSGCCRVGRWLVCLGAKR